MPHRYIMGGMADTPTPTGSYDTFSVESPTYHRIEARILAAPPPLTWPPQHSWVTLLADEAVTSHPSGTRKAPDTGHPLTRFWRHDHRHQVGDRIIPVVVLLAAPRDHKNPEPTWFPACSPHVLTEWLFPPCPHHGCELTHRDFLPISEEEFLTAGGGWEKDSDA